MTTPRTRKGSLFQSPWFGRVTISVYSERQKFVPGIWWKNLINDEHSDVRLPASYEQLVGLRNLGVSCQLYQLLCWGMHQCFSIRIVTNWDIHFTVSTSLHLFITYTKFISLSKYLKYLVLHDYVTKSL